MPVISASVDVVISNCVLNLVPNKAAAFKEMYRVLKQHGHFAVSDVVIKGTLPDGMRKDANMYCGCIAGAIDVDKYQAMLKEAEI